MGKTYRALHCGTVTDLNVQDGDFVQEGSVIAKTMWTDERGRSLTGGMSAPINAPFDCIVRVFVKVGYQFDKDEPLFHVERQ